MNSCGEDSGFKNGVLSAIETEEVAIAALVDGVGGDVSALLRVVESVDLKGVPTASVGKNKSVEFGQRVRLSKGGLGEKLHIVSDVKNAAAGAFEILVGRRSAIGAEDELGDRRVNDGTHRRDVDRAVFVLGGDDAFEDEPVVAEFWNVVRHTLKGNRLLGELRTGQGRAAQFGSGKLLVVLHSWQADSSKEILQQSIAVLGEDRLRVEL